MVGEMGAFVLRFYLRRLRLVCMAVGKQEQNKIIPQQSTWKQ